MVKRVGFVLFGGQAVLGAGNNRAVSTATASSFLNCPGGAVARGWSLAWPERVAGVAGPLADLAALVSPGLPGVPGPLQLRGRGSGSRRTLLLRIAAIADSGRGRASVPLRSQLPQDPRTAAKARQRSKMITGL